MREESIRREICAVCILYKRDLFSGLSAGLWGLLTLSELAVRTALMEGFVSVSPPPHPPPPPVTGSADMGGKQSVLGNGAFGKSPTLENIQAAYRDGESGNAIELIRISCGGERRSPAGKGKRGVPVLSRVNRSEIGTGYRQGWRFQLAFIIIIIIIIIGGIPS